MVSAPALPPGPIASLNPPVDVNRSDQSGPLEYVPSPRMFDAVVAVQATPGGDVEHAVEVGPNSNKLSLWTAKALGMMSTAAAIAAAPVHRKSQRLRRLPVGPITFLAIEVCLPSTAVRRRAAASLDPIAVHNPCGLLGG